MFQNLTVRGATDGEMSRLLHLVSIGVGECIRQAAPEGQLQAIFRKYAEEGNVLIERLDGDPHVLPWVKA